MRLLQIDAFTDKPFRGNPAAVCLLDADKPDAWMQSLATEMNLSETAFLRKENGDWDLRWFTPAVEVDLCGHATLASAHALWEEKILPAADTARFHTKSGLLTARRDGEWIELDFPAKPQEPVKPPARMLEALGIARALHTGKSAFDYLVEVESEEIVRGLDPDYATLRMLSARGIVVTSRSANREYDFVSRFFAPGSGIDEDPVTGSAHCTLAPYWAPKLKKNDFVAYQASARGGIVRVRLEGDRVKLGGRAVTVFRGDLEV